MRSLYESILDTDKASTEKVEDITFFLYFAECFVKVFGKVDRDVFNLDRRLGAPQRLGVIKPNNWKYVTRDNNVFVSKLHEMINMLEKKYPGMIWGIDNNGHHVVQDVWKTRYIIHFKLREYEFNWCIDVIEKSDKIYIIQIYSLHTRALKNKELLKLIDDNI